MAKLLQHIVARCVSSPKEKMLLPVVNQINQAWKTEQLLQKNLHFVGARPRAQDQHVRGCRQCGVMYVGDAQSAELADSVDSTSRGSYDARWVAGR